MPRPKTIQGLSSRDMARLEVEAIVGRSSILRAYHPDPTQRRVGLYTYVRLAKAAERLGLPLPPAQSEVA